MIFNSYLQDGDTDHLSQYSGPQKMAWVQLLQEYVSMAQQKILKVVQGVQTKQRCQREACWTAARSFSERQINTGQVLHQHDYNCS